MAHGYLRNCKTCEMLYKYKTFDKSLPGPWKYGYMCCLFLLDPNDKIKDREDCALLEIHHPEKETCEAWTPIREDE